MNARKIIAVANKKGGVGKTTTSIQVAQGLADRGKRGLILDFDHQCNLSNLLIEMESARGEDTYRPKPHPEHPEGGFYSVADMLTLKDWDVYSTGKSNNLSVLPAASGDNVINKQLLLSENEIISNFHDWMHNDLVWEKFDFVLIDTAPETSVMTKAAISAATDVLIPCVMEKMPFEGLISMFQFIEEYGIDKFGTPTNILGVLPTKFDSRISIHKRYHEFCKKSPMIKRFLLDVEIKERPVYKELESEGCSVPYRLNKTKKNAGAIDEMTRMTDFIEKELWG